MGTFDKLFGAEEPQDAVLTTRTNDLVGAPGDVDGLSADDRAVLDAAKAEIKAKAGKSDTFEGVSVRKQVVAGTNFFFKIKTGDNSFVHAKVFRDLPHNGQKISCSAVQTNKQEA